MPTWMLVLYVWGSPMHNVPMRAFSIPGYLTQAECQADIPAAMAKFEGAPVPVPGSYYEVEKRCVLDDLSPRQ